MVKQIDYRTWGWRKKRVMDMFCSKGPLLTMCDSSVSVVSPVGLGSIVKQFFVMDLSVAVHGLMAHVRLIHAIFWELILIGDRTEPLLYHETHFRMQLAAGICGSKRQSCSRIAHMCLVMGPCGLGWLQASFKSWVEVEPSRVWMRMRPTPL